MVSTFISALKPVPDIHGTFGVKNLALNSGDSITLGTQRS